MDTLKVTLVDDNEDSLEFLQFYIGQLPQFTIIDKCRNGEELIDSVARQMPDLVLLDINMPRLNGMDAIQSCLRINPHLLFIFITSYDEYAVQAFELSAVDYIVKPIEKTRLFMAMEKVIRYRGARTETIGTIAQRLAIKDGNDYYFIPTQDILFIEKVGGKCEIHTSLSCFTTNENISDMIKHLSSDLFFLSHRSYIINLTKISHIKAKNQTYIAFFVNSEKYAHISKLKFDELQRRIKAFNS
ncbi:LytR/AlgR family response regulator transcription factor [Paenibacillus xanthanilyticus]|uniref:LytR/AlgR family response regulator transcription factor n=1 Tax=Paenibacillus xanthanilyticus TaxID=1783531 RepID=A0ABV8K7W9_9BACL